MVTYLWIGLGGALGSIARAWMAIAVARFTGPQFPWGTILINILGSFIIGFFGTLTASDSRFAVPMDARAFVMVGICGGFTTFSSFSLQTLDLARDGRMLQAAGNVGVSVVLCLLAVTAGFYGAGAMQRVHARVAAAVTPLGDVVVAVLNRPGEAEALLDAGSRLLEINGGGRMTALAVRLPAAALLPSEEVLTASREAALRAEQEDWAGQLRATAERWGAKLRPRGIRTDWVSVEGESAEVLAERARTAGAIVAARPAREDSDEMRACLHAALFDSGCPVLIVPPGFSGPLGEVVAVAWQPDERAEKSLRAALPLLRRARSVHVLCAGDAAQRPPLLQAEGITALLHTVGGEGSTGEQLLRAAHEVGADLLVMGAFAHGEWRQMVFGGVTQTMLASADVPLLMRH